MRNKRLIVVLWRVVDFGVNHLDNLVIVSNFLVCYVWWKAFAEEESWAFFFSESLSLHITHEEISVMVKFSPPFQPSRTSLIAHSRLFQMFYNVSLNEWMNERMSSLHFLALLKQQRERPEKFRPERRFEPWTLRCRCSDLPVEPSGQLGTGCYVEIDHDNTRICIGKQCRMEWMNVIIAFF